MAEERHIIAEIEEGGGYQLTIFVKKGPFGPPLYDAERKAPDGSITTPQNDMQSDECIGYLAHLAQGYAHSNKGTH